MTAKTTPKKKRPRRRLKRSARLRVSDYRTAALVAPRLEEGLDEDVVSVQIAGEEVSLPSGALELLVAALHEMAAGRPVELVTAEREVGTQEAADLLNVSRPYFVKLLEEERVIPFRKVGRERRVLLSDLVTYKQRDYQHRSKIADQLAREAQELDLGY